MALGTQTEETALMQMIRQQMGAAIRAAIQARGMAPSFEALIAAIVANESGGNASKTRREPAELMQLGRVLMDEITEYQGIGSGLLMKAITRSLLPAAIVRELVSYCTSYGPMQIMGWHALKDGYPLSDLVTLNAHFARGAGYLLDFQRQFKLSDPQPGSLGQYLRCWNGGNPEAKTFDPDYVPDGIERMATYQHLGRIAA